MISTCDQASTNVSAIHQLINPDLRKSKAVNGGLLSYQVRDHTVIHCYDPPHLLKGIRNNLMTKKLIHHITKRWNIDESVTEVRRMASWKHLREAYKYSNRSSRKLLPKISSEHLDPKKSKMKVAIAAQVFSESFGNMILQHLSNNTNKRGLPKRYADTAEVLFFFLTTFSTV